VPQANQVNPPQPRTPRPGPGEPPIVAPYYDARLAGETVRVKFFYSPAGAEDPYVRAHEPTAGVPPVLATASAPETPNPAPAPATSLPPTVTAPAPPPTATGEPAPPTATGEPAPPTVTAPNPPPTATAEPPPPTTAVEPPPPTATTPATSTPPVVTDACVEGEVYLQGRSDHGGATVFLDEVPVGTTTRDGRFRFCADASDAPLSVGSSRTVAVRHACYLERRARVTLEPGATIGLPYGALAGGDVNDDALVNLFDLVRVAADYRSAPPTDPAADCTGDDVVNLFDLVLVGANYGRAGPMDWHTDATVGAGPDGAAARSGGHRAPHRAAHGAHDAPLGVTAAVHAVRALDEEHVEVDVVAHGMPPVYGAELRLSFDPERLRALDASERQGVQARPGSAWGGDGEFFVARNDIDNEAGAVVFAVSRMAPAGPLTGDLVLLSVTFAVREGPAEDAVRLDHALLLDVTRAIPVRWEGTAIYPTGPATWRWRAYLPATVSGAERQ